MNGREYFTDFEEVQGESERTEMEKCVRTEPWSLDDFVPVFNELGLLPDGPEYVCTRVVTTGETVVNGKHHIQKANFILSYRFDKEFTAELDGSQLAGVWATITVGGQVLLSELIYCSPEDIRVYHAQYLQGR